MKGRLRKTKKEVINSGTTDTEDYSENLKSLTDIELVGERHSLGCQEEIDYKTKMKAEQKQNIIDIMNDDEEDGLYDS